MLMQFFPSSVSCLVEMKDSLYHAKHMFHFGTHRGFRMFDCLEQLELFAACFLQLRRTLVDLIPDRLSFVVDKNLRDCLKRKPPLQAEVQKTLQMICRNRCCRFIPPVQTHKKAIAPCPEKRKYRACLPSGTVSGAVNIACWPFVITGISAHR